MASSAEGFFWLDFLLPFVSRQNGVAFLSTIKKQIIREKQVGLRANERATEHASTDHTEKHKDPFHPLTLATPTPFQKPALTQLNINSSLSNQTTVNQSFTQKTGLTHVNPTFTNQTHNFNTCYRG